MFLRRILLTNTQELDIDNLEEMVMDILDDIIGNVIYYKNTKDYNQYIDGDYQFTGFQLTFRSTSFRGDYFDKIDPEETYYKTFMTIKGRTVYIGYTYITACYAGVNDVSFEANSTAHEIAKILIEH